MVARSLTILLLASVLFCIFAGGDDSSLLDISTVSEEDATDAMRDDFASLDHPNVSQSIVVGQFDHEVKLGQYLSVPELLIFLTNIDEYFGKDGPIVKVMQIGVSAVGKVPLVAVEITRDVMRERRKILKPMFKFVANIHGDDAVGYALMVSLIQYLAYNDEFDARITEMLDNIDIWIIPTLNPDGLAKSVEGRCDSRDDTTAKYNGHGVDLDGDFPDEAVEIDGILQNGTQTKRQSETESMIQFLKDRPFVLSGNIQSGALVASYPWDSSNSSDKQGVPSLTQDNEFFEKVAREYAARNKMMTAGCACNQNFKDGITNGHQWRKKSGGMQDANYILSNCFELTLYLGCCKHPPANTLPNYWAANLESMLSFIESTRRGVYGLVVDEEGRGIRGSVIKVNGKDKDIKVTKDGEYWRLLVPGRYSITATAPGCIDQTQMVDVTEKDPYVQLNFDMVRTGLSGRIRESGNIRFNEQTVIQVVGEDKQVTANGNRKFWLPLDLGRHTITAKAFGYLMRTDTVDVTEDEPLVQRDFFLSRHGILCRVEDEGGRPVKKAVITVQNQPDRYNLTRSGEYWLRLGVGQNYSVTATACGFGAQTQTATLTNETPYVVLTFVMKRFYKKVFPCFSP